MLSGNLPSLRLALDENIGGKAKGVTKWGLSFRIAQEVSMRVRLGFLILALGLIFFSGHPVYADDLGEVVPTGLSVGVGAWISPTVTGVTKSGRNGTVFSLDQNLGLPSQTIVVPQFYYRWAHGQILSFRYQ